MATDTCISPKNKPKSKGKSKNKKWIRPRHTLVRNLLCYTLGTYTKIKYRIKIDKFKEQEKRPYLILMNHQTAFDQFFVGMAFKGPIYYLASEDIFSNGFVSSLIRYLVAPIPIKKQTTDLRAIMTCVRVVKEGGTIAIAPEGNRTYSGRTVYMSPSIASLAKKLGLPIALYRIEGGYGTHPRWSDKVRRGRMRGYVSRVVMPEEYAEMSEAQLFDEIREELYVDEAVSDACFYHKKSAEYLERAVYVCPKCGLSSFESHGDVIKCNKCGISARYLPDKTFEGIGEDFTYRYVADWYDAQSEYILTLDTSGYIEEPMYRERVSLYEVIPNVKKALISKEVELSLFADRAEICNGDEKTTIAFADAGAFTVLGRNKLNIYHGDKIYQVKGGKRFNALKYVHIYHLYKNRVKGDGNDKFLGL